MPGRCLAVLATAQGEKHCRRQCPAPTVAGYRPGHAVIDRLELGGRTESRRELAPNPRGPEVAETASERSRRVGRHISTHRARARRDAATRQSPGSSAARKVAAKPTRRPIHRSVGRTGFDSHRRTRHTPSPAKEQVTSQTARERETACRYRMRRRAFHVVKPAALPQGLALQAAARRQASCQRLATSNRLRYNGAVRHRRRATCERGAQRTGRHSSRRRR
jgi:hypothetical protein